MSKRVAPERTSVLCQTTHCGGELVKETISEPVGRPEQMMVGGQNPTRKYVTIYCSKCYLMYHPAILGF